MWCFVQYFLQLLTQIKQHVISKLKIADVQSLLKQTTPLLKPLPLRLLDFVRITNATVDF